MVTFSWSDSPKTSRSFLMGMEGMVFTDMMIFQAFTSKKSMRRLITRLLSIRVVSGVDLDGSLGFCGILILDEPV
jgi:hypothetical protein